MCLTRTHLTFITWDIEMAKREYSIFTLTRDKKIVKFVVSDAIDLDEANNGHPSVAIFLVSDRYTVDEQRDRASTFTAYMNKVAEATETAYKQTMLCDILKA